MGNVLKELGQLARGARGLSAKRCGSIPNIAGVYVNLADSKKFAPGDPHLAAMEALAAKTEGLSKTDRMQLDFALGKAYGDLQGLPPLVRASARRQCGQARDDRPMTKQAAFASVRPHRGGVHAAN